MILEKIVTLNDYASGSAMAYINGSLYLAGDNMAYVLVLDTDFDNIDTITIIDAVQSPMPKLTKPDIEAATTVVVDGTELLLLISSGSLDPYRNNAWLVNTKNKQKTCYDLGPFYARLKAQGITVLNIEGATTINDTIILAARGSNSTPVNHLISTTVGFWNDPATAPIDIKTMSTRQNAGAFGGVSGLVYSAASDRLLLTVSTENTANSFDDGEIGKSYLWIVNDLSSKIAGDVIAPDRIIDLEAADRRFHKQKIETACILSETESEMLLALAADNDDGTTVLFRLSIQK